MAVLLQGLQVAQKEAQIRLLEGRLRQTDMTGSSQNHAILDALREKAESHPELQALIHNVQQGRTQGWRVLAPGMLPVGRGTHTCQHQEAPGGAMAGTSVPRAPPGVMLGGDWPLPPATAHAVPSATQWVLSAMLMFCFPPAQRTATPAQTRRSQSSA